MNKDMKEYMDKLMYNNINYRILDVDKDEDKFRLIWNLDNKKMCFGYYDFDMLCQLAHDYYNLEVYYNDIFIGYIGWCNTNFNEKMQIIPTIILKNEYRHMGFGDMLLKKFINTVFLDYHMVDSIYIPVIKYDYVSLKLVNNNDFSRFEGYGNKDLKKYNYYLYKANDFDKNRKCLKKYGSIFK